MKFTHALLLLVNVIFTWILSHIYIHGNTVVDHEAKFMVGKTPCSYCQNWKELVVLTRCRIGHGRITNSYLLTVWLKSYPRLNFHIVGRWWKLSLGYDFNQTDLLSNEEGLYSVQFQLFIKTCFNRLLRYFWCSSDILPCQQFKWIIYKCSRRHNFEMFERNWFTCKNTVITFGFIFLIYLYI